MSAVPSQRKLRVLYQWVTTLSLADVIALLDAKLERIVEFRTWDDCIAIVADISVRFPDRYHTLLNYEYLDDSHSIVICSPTRSSTVPENEDPRRI